MNTKLIITKEGTTVRTFRFEDEMPVTIQIENCETSLLKNIYVGRVQHISPNIQGAFVEISAKQRCYLSLADVKNPVFCSAKHTSAVMLQEGDEILVQVIKDFVKTKDPCVSTNLSLTGKYVAVTYPDSRIGYSNKFTSLEKKEFQALFSDYRIPDFGYVIRTCAAELSKEQRESVIKEEIDLLFRQLKTLIETGKNRSIYSCLYKAPSKYIRTIASIPFDSLTKIVTDDASIYEEIVRYLTSFGNALQERVTLYEDDSFSLSKLHRLDTLLNTATSRKVWLKCGGYLIIEPTEALTVIDVNSGKCILRKDKEATALSINKEAALEIAAQLRLRNLSGIILVDFINLTKKKSQEELLFWLRNAVKKDSIKTNVIDMTPLGLVEITRQKTEQPLLEQVRMLSL